MKDIIKYIFGCKDSSFIYVYLTIDQQGIN